MKRVLIIIVMLQCCLGSTYADKSPLLFTSGKPLHIFVNNRILAKVNDKAISVIDVMKKMDMLFYRQFPEYSSLVEARFQFYQVNWKHVLNELVEKELIVADAEENKLQVSNGDIRQEMEILFGPNIIANLDKAGLTYDEAWKMVKEELTIRRMLMIRVNSKAIRTVTPLDTRAAYEEYVKENTRPDAWRYQVISIRGEDLTASAEAANYAYQLLLEDDLGITKLADKLKEHSLIGEKTTFNISGEYQHSEKEVSDAYKNILSNLEVGTFSKSIAQKSRANKSMVFRIFYLKERIPGGVTPLNEIENKLKDHLIEKAIDRESEQYMKKLRQHFYLKESEQKQMIPDDFQPFALK